MMKGGPGGMPDVEQFPTAVERVGENPARWLDHDLVSDEDKRWMAQARIEGIDYMEVAASYHSVERQLDRGPRDRVLEWIEDRMAELEERGDRDERPRRDPDTIREVSHETKLLDEDGEERDRGSSAKARVDSLRADGGH